MKASLVGADPDDWYGLNKGAVASSLHCVCENAPGPHVPRNGAVGDEDAHCSVQSTPDGRDVRIEGATR